MLGGEKTYMLTCAHVRVRVHAHAHILTHWALDEADSISCVLLYFSTFEMVYVSS